MKKIIYFVGFSFLIIGLNSCGESKAVVVGEGEGNNRYTESQNREQELSPEMKEKSEQLKKSIQGIKVETVPAKREIK